VSSEYQGIINFPEWRKLNLWENRNLWARVEAVAAVGANSENQDKLKISVEDQREIDRQVNIYQERAEQYHEDIYKMGVAELDIDNDGKTELVLREARGLCGENVHFKYIALFVLDEKGGFVDVQQSRPLFQDSESNRWDINVQESGTIGNGSMYDVFTYSGQTYFDRWSWTGIWIYRTSHDKTAAVCHLD
jgi:hypothetical protein